MPLQWYRTKKASFGVRTPSLNTLNGVSSCGGRLVRRISGRFWGNATSSRVPLSNGKSTVLALVLASASNAMPPSAACAPSAAAPRSKVRRAGST